MSQVSSFVDSHFHSRSMIQKGLGPDLELDLFFSAGGRWALDVGVHPRDWMPRHDARRPGVLLSAGLHPGDIEAMTEADWRDLETQIRHNDCVAVGELGLDWFRGRQNELAQRDAFARQILLAREVHKPIIVHDREADAEILEEFARVQWSGPGILHCFSSDIAFARKVLDLGLFLSFAGNVTYKSAHVIQEVAAWAPGDRILVETDSPYLAPVPHRGKLNTPRYVVDTATFVAGLRHMSVDAFLDETMANFERLFGLTDRAR